MSRIHWDHAELTALAKETAAELAEKHWTQVPDMKGNSSFLRPIIAEAMKRALKPDRVRPVRARHSITPLMVRYWPMVQAELDKLSQNGNGTNGHAPEPPPAPPPPPPPEKTLADFPEQELVSHLLSRLFQALATRQTIHIPALEKYEAQQVLLTGQVRELIARTNELNERLSKSEVLQLNMKQDLGRYKPPPPSVFCLGASTDTQKFLRNKADEARLEVDFRFMDAGAGPRPFKADYVLFFGQVGHDWHRQAELSVPKSHICFIGGRHDAAVVQLKDWLK